MNKLHIASDFDEVLRPYAHPFQERYNKKYDTNLSADDHVDYNFEVVLGIPTQQVIEELDDYCDSPEHLEVEPLESARESLERILKVGHKLTVVTARPPEVEESTREWLDRWIPGVFDDIVFCSHGAREGDSRSKESVLDEYEMDVLIDDSPSHVVRAQNHAFEGILFGDYSWNVLDEHREGITRLAPTWPDAEKHIHDIATGDD